WPNHGPWRDPRKGHGGRSPPRDRLRRIVSPDRLGAQLLHQLHAVVLLRRDQVPHGPVRADERGRAPTDPRRGAPRLLPESAAAGRWWTARDHLLPRLRGCHRRAGAALPDPLL